jgi:hypothetical protein
VHAFLQAAVLAANLAKDQLTSNATHPPCPGPLCMACAASPSSRLLLLCYHHVARTLASCHDCS